MAKMHLGLSLLKPQEMKNKEKLLKEARGKFTLPIEDQQSESHLVSLQTPEQRGMELRKCSRGKLTNSESVA